MRKKYSNLIHFLWVIHILPTFAQEKLPNQAIYLADPTIFHKGDLFYLYGTVEGNTDEGFLVYSSPDMKVWDGPVGVDGGFALQKPDVFGDKGFWAPQVFHYGGKIHMAYTANENIGIAESETPTGPFVQEEKKSLDAPVKQIDPFIYRDEDGTLYLYHVRLKDGNRIYVAELEDDLSSIKAETLTECIAASEEWENTAKAKWPVAEGPTVIKKGALYYLFYSANDFRNPDYAVGYAVSGHPLGPWRKYAGNPILRGEDIDYSGTGHGDLITDKQGEMWYVFHTHFSHKVVAPRRSAVIKLNFEKTDAEALKIEVDKESFRFLQYR